MNKVEKHAQICMKLNELYARKNADYGDSFGKSFEEYGLTMACIRLEDKLNRIKSLTKQAAQVSDESIVDTLMDLANYSIMTLVELAQSEPETALEKNPERMPHGSHCGACVENQPDCLCITCSRDNYEECGGDCCAKHPHNGCRVNLCADYVKEG